MRGPLTPEQFNSRMTEAEMEQTIRDLVAIKHGKVYHVRDARKAPELEGLPDLLIICPPVFAIVELKSAKREITTMQLVVNAMLNECTELVTGVYRPWQLDELLEKLA